MLPIRLIIKMFLTLVFVQSLLFSYSTSCPGSNIDNIHTNDGWSVENVTISANTTHYYTFTAKSDGTIQILKAYMDKTNNKLYIKKNCSSNLWSNTNFTNTKSSGEISVTKGDQITIAYERAYSSSAKYSLELLFKSNSSIANDDIYEVVINTAISKNILNNDMGPNIKINSIVSEPTNGTLTWTPDGSISYTPLHNYEGVDSFKYEIIDSNGIKDQAIVKITSAPLFIHSKGGRDFDQRAQYNIFGDVQVIGNTVLCEKNSNGSCKEPGKYNNNAINLQPAPISSSTLVIPEKAVVEFARIYWQGRITNGGNSLAKQDVIFLKKDNNSYTKLTANIIDSDKYSSSVEIYSASADAKSVVNGSGTYYVDASRFQTDHGKTSDGLGTYGAWVLVVVYNDPNDKKARNITVFDGYKQVSSDPVNISVSGFLTPRTGEVDSKAYVFAGEGDKYIAGDKLHMSGQTYNTSEVYLGTFDSRVDVDGTRNPNLINNNGIDIHKYDVGTTVGAKGIITTNEIGAKFKFSTTQDVYFPSLIIFSTELYLPQLCYDYSIKQDGQYLSINRETYPIATVKGRVSSSPLDVIIYLRNNEADVIARGISLTTSTQKEDENGTITNTENSISEFFKPKTGNPIYTSNTNGSVLNSRGNPSPVSSLSGLIYNITADNSVSGGSLIYGSDIRKGLGDLDALDYVYAKYTLESNSVWKNLIDVEATLDLSINYYIQEERFGNEKINYPPYKLGGENVPLCPPNNDYYQPEWGQFNVIQTGQKFNNIKTQISRKPFEFDVIFDSNPLTGSHVAPESDIKTTVLVEMIDIGIFGDINASCANPDSALTKSIVVPINFSETNYQQTVNEPDPDFYNFAVKNGAFRVWYFADLDGNLLENWTTNGTNSFGLYDSNTHIVCATKCSNESSADCFSCIKENYASPLCSRDNFSVRPESFDIHIADGDFLASSVSSFKPLDLAAEYKYRFDMNATGHDSLKPVPGYTRGFDSNSHLFGYKATLIWNPVSTTINSYCNDTSSTDISFYIPNGIMVDEEGQSNQIGKYKLNIIDSTWTAVDQNPSHHKANRGFDIVNKDCVQNNSSTLNGKHGCSITSEHSGGGITYKDHDLTFHPYKFDTSGISLHIGINDPNDTLASDGSFVYNSNDILNYNASDYNKTMAVAYKGSIKAVGYDGGEALSNFVDGCYAKDLNISLGDLNITNLNSSNTQIPYNSRLHIKDKDKKLINTKDIKSTNIIGSKAVTIVPTKDFFIKDLNGTMNIYLNINYDRDVNIATNPKTISYPPKFYEIDCANNDCSFKAKGEDLNTSSINTAKGVIYAAPADMKITHFYGRSFVDKQRYPDQTGTAPLSYEVYCDIDAGCDPTLLKSTNISLGGDKNWYINSEHIASIHGGITTTAQVVEQKVGTRVHVTGLNISTTTPQTTTIDMLYNGSRGFPYATTMTHKPQSWLIYNKHNANANANEFDAEFTGGHDGSWAGKHETKSTSQTDNAAPVTNRRTMW